MKYCVHCGEEICDEAVICVKCGCHVEQKSVSVANTQQKDDTMSLLVKIFLILGCVSQGWLIIPLAWCLPITIMIFRALRDGRPISVALKVCTLIFVNLIAGICLLCMNDNNK